MCWLFGLETAANAAGLMFNKWDVYSHVMGTDYSWPGSPASFEQLDEAATYAAQLMGKTLKRWNGNGQVDDVASFMDIARQQQYFLEAGVHMRDLVSIAGNPSYNDFWHFVVVRQLSGQDVLVVDSFRYQDGGSDQYSKADFIQAMKDNWTGNQQYAYAWQWV
ncbi:MAG TPA: hypothetical protein VF157_12160 [Chloroflexota bacterium]